MAYDYFSLVRWISRTCALLLSFFALTSCISSDAPQQNAQLASSNPNVQAAIEFMTERVHVIVSPRDPIELGRAMSGMNERELANLLVQLKAQDRGAVGARNANQSVVYVYMLPVNVGDRFETEWTYDRSSDSSASQPTDQPFTESYQYVVSENTPSRPLVIVNGAFSIFAGVFDFKLKRNGNTVFERRVIVPEDA